MKQALDIRQQLYQFEISLFRWKSHAICVGEPQFAHHCPALNHRSWFAVASIWQLLWLLRV